MSGALWNNKKNRETLEWNVNTKRVGHGGSSMVAELLQLLV